MDVSIKKALNLLREDGRVLREAYSDLSKMGGLRMRLALPIIL